MSTDKERSVLSDAEEEELRAQVLQLLLELEEARDTAQKHQESFLELQGEKHTMWPDIIFVHL